MTVIILVISASWIVVSIIAVLSPALITTTLLAGLGSASVAIGLAWSARAQAKRQTTLALHREYYSHEFAIDRDKATRFFHRYADRDWSKEGPYAVPDPDNTRSGYSQVIRYFHRVATLYDAAELDRSLTQRLLSRELGYWFGFVFQDMSGRTDMYTKEMLFRLNYKFKIGESVRAYEEGYQNGRDERKRVPLKRWVKSDKRWTTKNAQYRSQQIR